jgi:hypothetical protein
VQGYIDHVVGPTATQLYGRRADIAPTPGTARDARDKGPPSPFLHDTGGPLPKGGATCTTAATCQLNGLCIAGRCVCDAAWTGSNCSAPLDLLPAPLEGAL